MWLKMTCDTEFFIFLSKYWPFLLVVFSSQNCIDKPILIINIIFSSFKKLRKGGKYQRISSTIIIICYIVKRILTKYLKFKMNFNNFLKTNIMTVKQLLYFINIVFKLNKLLPWLSKQEVKVIEKMLLDK